jgi:hypothetical protein
MDEQNRNELEKLLDELRAAPRASDESTAARVRFRLANTIRDCLYGCRKNPELVGKDFICKADLDQIFVQYHCLDELFYNLLDRTQLNVVAAHYIKVVSILIFIHWDNWPDFASEFLGQWNYSDAYLPFTDIPRTVVRAGPSVASRFRSDQYVFAPVILHAKSDAQHHERLRLPLFAPEPLGNGAFGVVTKYRLAARHMVWYDGSYETEAPQVCARMIPEILCTAFDYCRTPT